MLKNYCDVYFDAPNARLVYVGKSADEGDFWDEHWLTTLTAADIRKPDRYVVNMTKRYLPMGSKVVDAGCGVARTVYGLHQAGFDAYGVDFAPKTVATLNRLVPELKISVADVRNMSQFEDGFFDGLWSLGVIEHFYDGYEQIVRETQRLIRPGGYAFVIVPAMSPLRRIKAALGAYSTWTGAQKEAFYQFILPPTTVVRDFESAGFRLASTHSRGGFKGFKDEMWPSLRSVLQALYDNKFKPARALLMAMDLLLRPVTYHTKLWVFQKLSP